MGSCKVFTEQGRRVLCEAMFPGCAVVKVHVVNGDSAVSVRIPGSTVGMFLSTQTLRTVFAYVLFVPIYTLIRFSIEPPF